MENASKALIIAGAILISIVIISLGVVIIGQGQDVVNQSNMDDQVVSTWNQKWTQYEGNAVSGSNVNTLMNQVLSNNVVASRNGEPNKIIQLASGGTGTQSYKIAVTDGYVGCDEGETRTTQTYGTKTVTTKAKPGAQYKVELKYNGYGYVCKIIITPIT